MQRARRAFWVAWGALVLLRALLGSQLPLLGDEAFYAWEARHLAWAYSDVPPMTAWLIAAGTALAGAGESGVRLGFLALGALMPWQMVWLARRVAGERAGWSAGLWFQLIPITGLLGLLALPDVPMTVATLLCLHACVGLVRGAGRGDAVLLAAGLALGALSHYRFGAALVAGAVGLLWSGQLAALLRHPRVWVALAAGALAWWPLLAFNLAHAGAGLQFHLVERHPWSLQLSGLLHLPAQALVVTPVLYAALLAAGWAAWRRWRAQRPRDPVAGLLLGMAVVPVLGFAALALVADSERVSFHWVVPGYLALLVLLPGWLAQRPRWRRAAAVTAVVGLVVGVAWTGAVLVPGGAAALAGGPAYPDNFSGWREIGQAVRTQARLRPDARVVADNFMLGAQLARVLGDERPVHVLDHPLNRKHGRALQLALWGLDEAALAAAPPGSPVLLVVEDSAIRPRDRLSWYQHWCTRLSDLQQLGRLSLDEGRKRFILLTATLGAGDPAACVLPAMAYRDQPAREAEVSGPVDVSGWAFKDGAPIRSLWLALDGRPVAPARYGLARPDVHAYWSAARDPSMPHIGFEATLDAASLPAGRYRLSLRVDSDAGREWLELGAIRVVAR